MLSEQEKQEMLEDGRSSSRREHFRAGRRRLKSSISFDEYLAFLNSLQEIFSPFKVSRKRMSTQHNKL